jgi:hypothetical protein
MLSESILNLNMSQITLNPRRNGTTYMLTCHILYLTTPTFNYVRSRDSIVGIATGYGLDDRGLKIFSVVHVVQTGSGPHPVSCPVGTGVSFTGLNLQGREADYSRPTSGEVKKM